MEYRFIFLWLLIIFVALNLSRNAYVTSENGYTQNQIRWFWALVAFFPIFYIAVFEAARSDVLLYISRYKALPANWGGMAVYLGELEDSHLFWFLSFLIKMISGTNVRAFRFIIALIQSIPVIYVFRKYSHNYLLSLYLFVASAIPLAWMMNGIRQFVAVAIIFAATPLMIKKDYLKLVVLILIASMFHQSAIIMLPIVFIAQGKAWNWKTLILIVVAIIAVYVFTNDSGAFDTMMESAGYSSEIYVADDGTNPLRVLVSFVPVALAFIGRKQLERDDIPIMNLAINMSIISFGIYLVSMVTSGILVGRAPIYVSMYSFILLPYLLKRLFDCKSYKLMLVVMIVFYGLYYYVQYA